MFTNKLNMSLQLEVWVKKKVYGMETKWPTGKEKVLVAVVSKDGHADSSGIWKYPSLLISLKKVQL